MRGNLFNNYSWLLPLVLYTGITYSSSLWFLLPVFLASCFYAVSTLSLQPCFLRLFGWSFIAASIMIFPCLFVLGEFCSLVSFCGALFLLMYASLSVFILIASLLVVGKIERIRGAPLIQFFVWSSLFILWWWFVDTLFFVSVGVSCGYVIANPVLCCAVLPASCVLVKYVGVYGLLALYCIAAGGSVVWWVCNSRASGIFALGALLLLLTGAMQETFLGQEVRSLLADLLPDKLSTDVSLRDQRLTEPWSHVRAFKLSSQEEGVLQTALTLQEQFLTGCDQIHGKKRYPKNLIVPDLIIGPESCLSCALNKEPSLCALFDNVGSCASPLVIIGARREEVMPEHLSRTCKKSDSFERNLRPNFVTNQNKSAQQKNDTYNSEHKIARSFNSLFILHQGRIIFYYDKTFPLPFLETSSHVPTFFTYLQGFFSLKQKLCRSLFFENKTISDQTIVDHPIEDHVIKNSSLKNYPSRLSATMPATQDLFLSHGRTPYVRTPHGRAPYSLGTGSNAVTLTLGGVTYQAHCALCSDFFCTNNVLAKQREPNALLIVLVNDAWFYGDSVASRMHRYAVLWAMQRQVPVLYVGYQYASWIEPSGRVWSLATLGS